MRDASRHAPVFVLSPARSNSSVVTAMLGQHPELCVFPELALFRKETVGELLSDPPGWKGAPARLRMAGVYRALAEHHDGAQTSDTVAAAARWVEARSAWDVADLFDHLLELAAPRIGIEKSPESSARDEYLARLVAAYPRARYLHLTRHPVTSVDSMYRSWSDKAYWRVARALPPFLPRRLVPPASPHRGARSSLPADRVLRVRSEDVLNAPAEVTAGDLRLARYRRQRASDRGDVHPEDSPYAVPGPRPPPAAGTRASSSTPCSDAPRLPDSLDLPAGWAADPWLELAARELAARLGY